MFPENGDGYAGFGELHPRKDRSNGNWGGGRLGKSIPVGLSDRILRDRRMLRNFGLLIGGILAGIPGLDVCGLPLGLGEHQDYLRVSLLSDVYAGWIPDASVWQRPAAAQTRSGGGNLSGGAGPETCFAYETAVLTGSVEMKDFLLELWAFVTERKKLWLLPIIIILALLGSLIVFTQGSAVAPFIYTLF